MAPPGAAASSQAHDCSRRGRARGSGPQRLPLHDLLAARRHDRRERRRHDQDHLSRFADHVARHRARGHGDEPVRHGHEHVAHEAAAHRAARSVRASSSSATASPSPPSSTTTPTRRCAWCRRSTTADSRRSSRRRPECARITTTRRSTFPPNGEARVDWVMNVEAPGTRKPAGQRARRQILRRDGEDVPDLRPRHRQARSRSPASCAATTRSIKLDLPAERRDGSTNSPCRSRRAWPSRCSTRCRTSSTIRTAAPSRR